MEEIEIFGGICEKNQGIRYMGKLSQIIINKISVLEYPHRKDITHFISFVQ